MQLLSDIKKGTIKHSIENVYRVEIARSKGNGAKNIRSPMLERINIESNFAKYE